MNWQKNEFGSACLNNTRSNSNSSQNQKKPKSTETCETMITQNCMKPKAAQRHVCNNKT